MIRWLGRAAVLLSGVAGTLVLAACPVPASYTTATSAPLTGHIAWEDGTPASGAALLVSTEWGRTPCEKVALRTMSDGAGDFEFAGITAHHSVMWIVPNLDIASPRYDICVALHDTVQHVYTGRGSLSGTADRDKLDCVIWRWGGGPRVACNGLTRQAVASGGSWSDSAHTGRAGYYRPLLTEEPTQVKGYKKKYPQPRPYIYVQWVESGDAGSGARIVIDTTVSLPIDRNKVTAIRQLKLWRREGKWVLSLEGSKKEFWSDYEWAELIFALGAPGDATLVAGP